jgi:tripartite ATP-independent transporter DctP family solute receptor
MMLKKFRCLVLAMVLILVFVSCTTFAAVKPVKLVYGSVFEGDGCYGKGDAYFKELVEKNSKGKILVELYPLCQLGSIAEMCQAVKSGAQQMVTSAISEFAPLWSKLGTFDLPYIYRDQEHMEKVASRFSSLIDLKAMAEKSGVRIIGVRIRPSRQLTTKFPVNKFEDIKGLKIRVPQSPLSVALWKALGTIPTVLPGNDVYTALATGTIDAQENPFESIYMSKFYEQVKYCALTAHKSELVVVVVNNKLWKSLKTAQRKIIQDALDKSNELANKLALDNNEKYYQLLIKAGMKFTKPDLVPFREKAKTIWGQFGDANVIKKIQAVK